MPIPIAATRDELRELLSDVGPGLVPTMGALHAGHLALIARSARENELTVVSVFVNPTQFGSASDLERYPRDLSQDSALAETAGASVIFAPIVETIYPRGFDTWVDPGELSTRWEGTARPGHFRGVATVVTILLNLVQPSHSYFGEKDYQQLQIIRRLHRDLALPGEIVSCETVRDVDGVALSSRNARLSPEDRRRARAIPQAIAAVKRSAAEVERNIQRLRDIGHAALANPGIGVDYLAMVDSSSLQPLSYLEDEARLLIAVDIGGVRLIDNAPITIDEQGST